ncbi:hypothetical protein [Jiella pacifica]|nr:hypothetical protein [Jiella pacifica]
MTTQVLTDPFAGRPDRVDFSPGASFERDAAARLRRSLDWLVR